MTQDKGVDGPGRLAGLDGVMLFATMLTLFGYLLPWFRQSPRHQWWYSGWEYASRSTGGGWARTVVEAAMAALAAGIGTLVMTVAVVAASFGNIGRRDNLNSVAELPFGLGLPLMAVGLGLLIAAACRDLARA
ncbi:hypothetical protein ABT008_26395 [Micromonospora sp. NPDC002389]|uniref:hypothetical protein n=1 Tax=Micromonospora sp. NPDC002389 TaxID=3154272 RepID=UPI003324CA50